LAVCAASALTSWATTAKPRRLRRTGGLDGGIEREKIGLLGTEVISLMTSPIRLAACDSALMRESVSSACLTALAAMRLDSWTGKNLAHRMASSSVPSHRLHVVGGVLEALRPRWQAVWYCRIVAQCTRGASSSFEAADSEVMIRGSGRWLGDRVLAVLTMEPK